MAMLALPILGKESLMTFSAPDPVSSGRPYRISASAAGPPSLKHFIGNGSFTLDKDGVESVVSGSGAADGTGVRFYEKDVEHGGKDVRAWQITQDPDGQFVATPVAAW
jgi:hypothetical protein